ncbi:hypothetical protein F3Y22_tig00110600pilonHSYRG00009 [Hibiscus syriacus]|uniref:Protein kinase domain-containing protein n=1 Tax=Hibiscus syriacus TaxID=106335 RepID=A0A6A3A3I3_HIBSY|nr:hypothetical protein F3Y22_tig00110600pilonHSYRG00009 [Hibiscus syriacus]
MHLFVHTICLFDFPICSGETSAEVVSLGTELEDCSTTTTECIEPNEESTGSAESIESEPTSANKARVSSYPESQNGISQIVQWRGFSRILKRGLASQSLPPAVLNLPGRTSRFRIFKKQPITSALEEGMQRFTKAIDFLSELGIIVHVDHPNIAKLIGYGVEGGMHLVLQLSPHGSLASILYGSKEKLNWQLRFKIALGAAEGLCYLHEGCQRRIIHKDIKASNICFQKTLMLNYSLKSKEHLESCHDIYLPPEFFMHGVVDEKTDVYAFGVLLLELITGRQAIDSSQQSLVMWVVEILKGNDRGLEVLKQWESEATLQRTYSEEIFDAEENNSTKILNDINHQMWILLEQSNDA